MIITQITRDMLPLHAVEAKNSQGEWKIFTGIPFKTITEAENHRQTLLTDKAVKDLYDFKSDELRIRQYTYQDWQSDLINAIINNEEANRRVLSLSRPETLVDALK